MYLNPGPITKSKSCPKNWCTQPKDAGLEIISLQSQGPTANMLLNPLTKGCTKQTVYTGGRRLVRGYVCKIMSIIYIKLLCTYLHWHTNQSISISPLQLTKRRFASARADRRHTAAIRPIESGRFVSRFDALTPCLPQSRKVEEEAQWKPMGVLWMLHPFCQQVNKRHTSSDGGTPLPMCLSSLSFFWKCLHCHWKHFNKTSFAVNLYKTIASECTS